MLAGRSLGRPFGGRALVLPLNADDSAGCPLIPDSSVGRASVENACTGVSSQKKVDDCKHR